MRKKITTEKASDCFTRLYGRGAYEAWTACEKEIDGLMKSRTFTVPDICRLREENYRRMKLGTGYGENHFSGKI